jgi:hypothetical protein
MNGAVPWARASAGPWRMGRPTPSPTIVCAVLLVSAVVSAQQPPAGGRGQQPPQTPRASAPIDLTGYWVSIVNEDWRWRMVTPPKGDYASVPMTDEARKVADAWDISRDGRCEAYGAAALMRMPTRLRVTWEGDNVLRIETDAGQQTRRLLFDRNTKPGGRTLQGHSLAEWERPAPQGRGQAPGPGGNLKVVTNNLRGGWLRKNGVPYSDNAVVTEYYDRFEAPTGDQWFTVTTIVEDPHYLTQPFVTSSHFKKEPDGAKWSPSPCKTT